MNIKTPRIDDALAGSCGDPACPCRDGDACHYRDGKDGTKAWPKPEPQGEREAFEAWAKAEYFSLVLSGVKDLFHFGTHTEAAWLGWQAARAQEPAPVPAGTLPPGYMLAKLQMVMPLFQEARDALTVVTEPQRRMYGIRFELVDRMDKARTFSLDDWLAAVLKGEK